MKYIFAFFLALSTFARAETIELILALPIQETRYSSNITVNVSRDLVGVARPYIDENGDFGRVIDEGMLQADFGIFVHNHLTPGLMADVKSAIEGEIRITGAEMDASAAAIGIVGSWAGGVNELRATIHAVMHKIADIAGQPDAWADAYYAALEVQLLAQLGQ